MSDEQFASDTEESTFPSSLKVSTDKGTSSVPMIGGVTDFELNSQIIPNSQLEDDEEEEQISIGLNSLLVDSMDSSSSLSVDPEPSTQITQSKPKVGQYSRRIVPHITNVMENSQIITNSLLKDSQSQDVVKSASSAPKPMYNDLLEEELEEQDIESLYADMEFASMLHGHDLQQEDEFDALFMEEHDEHDLKKSNAKSPNKIMSPSKASKDNAVVPVAASITGVKASEVPVDFKNIPQTKKKGGSSADDSERVQSMFSSLYFQPYSMKSALHLNFPFPSVAIQEEDLKYAEHQLRLKHIATASAFRDTAAIMEDLDDKQCEEEEEEDLEYRILRKDLPLQAHTMQTPRVLSKMGIHGKYLGVHTDLSHGYLLVEPEMWKENRLVSKIDECRKGSVEVSLQDTPINTLLANVEQHNVQLAIDRSVGLCEHQQTTGKKRKEELLYVDKYAPKGYHDLVSNETVNLEAMSWQNQWNIPVFSHTRGVRATSEDVQAYKKLKEQQALGKAAVLEETLPVNGPKQKIQLLHGPAGTGKTTLANIIAKHCGYKAIEINASDDRSAKELVPRITNALENSLATSTSPVCLILDEIDGVVGGGDDESGSASNNAGAIQLLVKYAQQAKLHMDNPELGKAMLRPVICICNDVHAPALRALLPHTRQLHVSGVDNDALQQRLAFVCAKEKIDCPGHIQRALVQTAQGDMRNCLHTLQFLKFSGKKLNAEDIAKLCIGEKDSVRSAQHLYERFLQPLPRDRLEVYNTVEQITDPSLLDKVLDGVYYNIHATAMVDPHVYKLQQSLELLSQGNLLAIRHLDDFAAYIPAEIQTVCQPSRKLVMQQPRYMAQQDLNAQRNHAMASMFMKKGVLFSKNMTSTRDFHLYISSYLLELLVPRLDTPALHMFKEHQWREFRRVVQLMTSCDLHYIKHFNNTYNSYTQFNRIQDQSLAAFEWRLDPPLADLHRFNYSSNVDSFGITVKASKSSFFGFDINAPINSKQYQKVRQNTQVYSETWNNQRKILDALVEPLNQEVLFENMRTKNAQDVTATRVTTTTSTTTATTTSANTSNKNNNKNTSTPSKAKPNSSTAANIAEEIKPVKRIVQVGISSFVHKKRKELPEESPNNSSSLSTVEPVAHENVKRPNVASTRANHTLHFAFIEGFSDAVKKPVKMSEFLDI